MEFKRYSFHEICEKILHLLQMDIEEVHRHPFLHFHGDGTVSMTSCVARRQNYDVTSSPQLPTPPVSVTEIADRVHIALGSAWLIPPPISSSHSSELDAAQASDDIVTIRLILHSPFKIFNIFSICFIF